MRVVLLSLALWLAEGAVPSCREKTHGSSYLWRVFRQPHDPPVYLFGTIHVPYTRVWSDVAHEAITAFKASDKVVFELDLSDPDTLQGLYSCKLLPDGARLDSVLPLRLFERVRDRMEAIRVERDDASGPSVPRDWERLRPVWVLLLLNSFSREGVEGEPAPSLDEFLAQKAHFTDKEVGAIEEVSEQCDPLNSLGQSEVEFALERSVENAERRRKTKRHPTKDLIHHYNCGSLNAHIFNRDTVQLGWTMDKASRRRAAAIDDYFHRELIQKRNLRMAARLQHTLTHFPKDSFFFAFGAGHFFGSDNILELLQASGYTVVPVRRERAADTHSLSFRSPSGGALLASSLRRHVAPAAFHKAERTPQFRELWVRLPDFQPRPWQEIEAQPQVSSSSSLIPSLLSLSSLLLLFVALLS